eukprot:COSAG04_NODE_2187_length_4587_cov_20.361773_5_plen_129_part_00
MSTRRLGELWRHVATPASSAATTAIEEPEPPAMAAEIEQFRDTGVVVLRGLLSSEEMDRLKGPHVQAYENLDYDGRDQLKDPTKTYPAPGVYSMGAPEPAPLLSAASFSGTLPAQARGSWTCTRTARP